MGEAVPEEVKNEKKEEVKEKVLEKVEKTVERGVPKEAAVDIIKGTAKPDFEDKAEVASYLKRIEEKLDKLLAPESSSEEGSEDSTPPKHRTKKKTPLGRDPWEVYWE